MEQISGRAVADAINARLMQKIQDRSEKGRQAPVLALVRIGEREDDLSYERSARKRMERLGIDTTSYSFPKDISMSDFEEKWRQLNNNSSIDGILLFRPLPQQIDEKRICALINPDKDVDGISPQNMARVFAGDAEGFAPCTAEAVMETLHYMQIPLSGQNAVVVGRSMVVGRPLAMLLLQENCTVTICHSKTRNLAQVCSGADLLVAAVGRAHMITETYVRQDAIVMDVGINYDTATKKLVGDVDMDSIATRAAACTPVPGGIGLVTTAVLAAHVVRAADKKTGGTKSAYRKELQEE